MRSFNDDESQSGVFDSCADLLDRSAVVTAVGDLAPRPAWDYSRNPDVIRALNSHDRITSSELNQAADLDWSVIQTPAFVYTPDPAGPSLDEEGYAIASTTARGFKLAATAHGEPPALLPGLLVNVRDDTFGVLGVVRKRYRILQNSDAPNVLDGLVETGEARYETAGTLHGGARVWWLARLTDPLTVAGDPREQLQIHVLLSSSHDGSAKTILSVLPLRVASQTTLAWPLPTAPRTLAFPHTNTAHDRKLAAHDILELDRGYRTALAEVAEGMVETELSDEQFARFLNTLLPTPSPRTQNGRVLNQRGITMADDTKGAITHIYHYNQTQRHLSGTVWGLVQACQFYSDHLTINRNTDEATAAENRFARLTSEATLGSRAFTYALAMI